MTNELHHLVYAQPRSRLRPARFFVAWHGVMTLAFAGFTSAILHLKKDIEALDVVFEPEHPGTRWPHTTLGALKDKEELSLEDLNLLYNICTSFDNQLWESDIQFEVKQLNWIRYECCSLEKRLETQSLPFNPALPVDEEIPDHHSREVETILSPFSRSKLPMYWHAVSMRGHHEGHYRAPVEDTTLVFDWPDQQPELIQTFIDTIEAHLPGRYVWFEPRSRHVTIRSLSKKLSLT